MEESLPLLPGKGGVCGSARGVLREVFRDLDYRAPPPPPPPPPPSQPSSPSAVLPPLASATYTENRSIADPWPEQYFAERAAVWQREGELKHEHARRKARAPPANKFRLHAPSPPPHPPPAPAAALRRRDLMPAIEQNAGRDTTLWIKNILNSSSGDVSHIAIPASPVVHPAPTLEHFAPFSDQSLSVGVRPAPLGPCSCAPRSPPAPAPAAAPDHILCVPPQLDFVNFTLGQLHTARVRLVNVSGVEVRVGVVPPARRALRVTLRGRLAVTSGAAAELLVHFRPRDVRPLRDRLRLRVSHGPSELVVPIACYMLPPLLDVLVPNASSSSLSCTPGGVGPGAAPHAGDDVLELGARLLGDVHCARVLFHCAADHAAFFLLTEDAWLSFTLSELTRSGSVVEGPFVVSPAWWRGGGAVRARAWCRARTPGLHAAALRVAASTAVVRPLYLLADALYYRPDHITLQAQEKDYDVCSEDDPACQYYVHLGTALPGRALAATVLLLNHSPVTYSYYWSVRPWGVCSCGREEPPPEDASEPCAGAGDEAARAVRVEPAGGRVAARSSCALHVRVPDAGAAGGTRRAVLMLILKDVPEESFPPDVAPPDVLRADTVRSDPVPGLQRWERRVCQVVHSQLEVWWHVAPLRFVLDPPALRLVHSRRVPGVDLQLRATQLFGGEGAQCVWHAPPAAAPPPALRLTPAHSMPAHLYLPLPSHDQHPHTDLITLVAPGGVGEVEWSARCVVSRRSAARAPTLRAACSWLGVVPPGARVRHALTLTNDTHQHMCWGAEAWRWWGERVPAGACGARGAACGACGERACTCALLQPTRGALPPDQHQTLQYDVSAPDVEGCVATLVAAGEASGEAARAGGRAALAAYRVLAPRLVLRALPCHGDHAPRADCADCCMVGGAGAGAGEGAGAVVRPARALCVGRRTCYRLRVTNLTPLATTVRWEPPQEEDVLKMTFIPNDFDVGSYAQVEIKLVVRAVRAGSRRVVAARAHVSRAPRPLYLLLDAAVMGVEAVCEVPLGGTRDTSDTAELRRTEREACAPEETVGPPGDGGDADIFAEEDRQRWRRTEICRCKGRMQYVPPPAPRPGPEPAPIQIVTSPPALVRVCVCRALGGAAPELRATADPCCLQFCRLPLHTEWSRVVRLRSESQAPACWRAALRRYPRTPLPRGGDAWRTEGCAGAGLALWVEPARGTLPAAGAGAAALTLCARAHTWGLYHDQLLIQIEHVAPLVLDVWVEAVGAPLLLAMAPRAPSAPPTQLSAQCAAAAADVVPTLWMSAAERERVVCARNGSLADVRVRACLLRDDGLARRVLPLRLYARLFDAPPRTCPCMHAFPSDSCPGEGTPPPANDFLPDEICTGIELFLAADLGLQDDTYYKVEPAECVVLAGARAEWRVLRAGHAPPDHTLLLRVQPEPPHDKGEAWRRPEPAPLTLLVREAERAGQLAVSRHTLRVRLCALDLPAGDALRVRKRLRAQNVGSGWLNVRARAEPPWGVLSGAAREHDAPLSLPPDSSTEVCVEVCLVTAEVWPRAAPWPCEASAEEAVPLAPDMQDAPLAPVAPHAADVPDAPLAPVAPVVPDASYAPTRIIRNKLYFYDEATVLQTVCLAVELEFPLVTLAPRRLELGAVCHGDVRKGYFTVTHSSRCATLELATRWRGGAEWAVWPAALRVPPGEARRVYVRYCARPRGPGGAPALLWLGVALAGPAAWCRAAAAARALPSRDHKCHLPPHDHTDLDLP